MNHTNRIESLDALRGISSLIVVIFHCLLSFNIFYYANYHLEFSNTFVEILTISPLHTFWAGNEAVLLFFVLSGFVLTIPFMGDRPPIYHVYIVRRFFRIYMPYIVVMILSVVLVTLFAGVKDVDGLSSTYENRWDHAVSLKAIVAYFLMLDTDTANVNGVVWSLFHEMRISIVFPLFLVIILKYRFIKALLISLCLNLAFYLALHLASTMLGDNSITGIMGGFKDSVYYCTFFIFGAFLSKYRENLSSLKTMSNIKKLGLICLALILINCRWIYPVFNVQNKILQDFVSVLGILLLFVFILTSGTTSKFLTKKPLLWLGKVSYSLYLIHIPVMMLTTIFLGKIMPIEIAFIFVPILSLPVAHFTHKYIEVPSNALGKKAVSIMHSSVFSKKVVAETKR
ncbi:acyltransferase family protein [Paenibacillus sp. B-A-8]|uniref:acyltransferase family protein n=1 Tax=Paenibacillus sp. B-A-8 TaxID=3400419 RepID=UPI003B017DAC